MDILRPKLPSYTDERGTIEMIVEDVPFKSVSRITSVAGVSRAIHVHFLDFHYCILTKGKMEYYESDIYAKEKPIKLLINVGDVFYTATTRPHQMFFLEDSEFWCFSKNSRKQNDYELDTVRLPFNLKEIYDNWGK